jgi:hypothetical protein
MHGHSTYAQFTYILLCACAEGTHSISRVSIPPLDGILLAIPVDNLKSTSQITATRAASIACPLHTTDSIEQTLHILTAHNAFQLMAPCPFRGATAGRPGPFKTDRLLEHLSAMYCPSSQLTVSPRRSKSCMAFLGGGYARAWSRRSIVLSSA